MWCLNTSLGTTRWPFCQRPSGFTPLLATQLQAGIWGAAGTREDMQPTRFGTVRPRVQIPGPRPVFEFKACLLFLYESAAATASKSRITPVAWRPLVFAGVRRRSTQVAADGPVSGPPALHGTERHLELRHDEPQMREGSHASRVNAVRWVPAYWWQTRSGTASRTMANAGVRARPAAKSHGSS